MKKKATESYRNEHTDTVKKLNTAKKVDGEWEMSANHALKVNYLTNGRYSRK